MQENWQVILTCQTPYAHIYPQALTAARYTLVLLTPKNALWKNRAYTASSNLSHLVSHFPTH